MKLCPLLIRAVINHRENIQIMVLIDKQPTTLACTEENEFLTL